MNKKRGKFPIGLDDTTIGGGLLAANA